MFGNLTKTIGPVIGKIVGQNKNQESAIGGLAKTVGKIADTSKGDVGNQLKPMMSDLQKAMKLLTAQTEVLTKIGDAKLEETDDKEMQKALDELMEEARRIIAENDKQVAELESLAKEIDKAAKDAGGDKDKAKKVKTASAALDKAMKLLGEQNKALEEVKKALAD